MATQLGNYHAPAKLGERFAEVFRILGGNWKIYLGITSIFLVPTLLSLLLAIVIIATKSTLSTLTNSGLVGVIVLITPFLIANLIAPILNIITLIHASEKITQAEPISIMECIQYSLREFWGYVRTIFRVSWYVIWPVFIVSFAAAFAAMALSLIIDYFDIIQPNISNCPPWLVKLKQEGGCDSFSYLRIFALLAPLIVLPAVWTMAIYRLIKSIFAIYAAASEKIKIGEVALRTSLVLTKNRWWRTFGNLVAINIPIFIISFFVNFITAQNSITSDMANLFLQLAFTPIITIFIYLLYRRYVEESANLATTTPQESPIAD